MSKTGKTYQGERDTDVCRNSTCNDKTRQYSCYSTTIWRLPVLSLRLRTSDCSLLLIYACISMLSWPGWLTYSGRFAHISGHPSAAGRSQDSESSPVKDQRSTVPHTVWYSGRTLVTHATKRGPLATLSRCLRGITLTAMCPVSTQCLLIILQPPQNIDFLYTFLAQRCQFSQITSKINTHASSALPLYSERFTTIAVSLRPFSDNLTKQTKKQTKTQMRPTTKTCDNVVSPDGKTSKL